MTSFDDNSETLAEADPSQLGLDSNGGIWTAATLVLGASLWAQMFWYPMTVELQTPQPSTVYLVAYLAPWVVLAMGVLINHPAVSLFGVPFSFLPGLVLLPDRDLAALAELPSAGFVAATWLIYLGVAGYSIRPSRRGSQGTGTKASLRRVEGTYPGFIAVRVAILVGLLAAMIWVILFDPATVRQFESAYGEHVQGATVFTLIFGFFAWCVAAYAVFFRPLSNLEYDVRALARGEGTVPQDTGGPGRRMIVWGIVGAAGILLLATSGLQ